MRYRTLAYLGLAAGYTLACTGQNPNAPLVVTSRANQQCYTDCGGDGGGGGAGGGGGGGAVPRPNTDTVLTVSIAANVWLAQPGNRGNAVMAPQSVTFTASVANSPGDHTFYWSVLSCDKDQTGTYCTDGYQQVPPGVDLDTLVYDFTPQTDRIAIAVEVSDASGRYTGVDTITVLGPAEVTQPQYTAPTAFANFLCSTAPDYYPFPIYGTGAQINTIIGYYDRNPCDGTIENDPNPPL